MLVGIEISTDIPEKLKERKMYRRNRRSTKTRYRKARFNNRKKAKGWLPPSIEHKLSTHVRLIEKVKRILPVSNVIVEVASFDTQKFKESFY